MRRYRIDEKEFSEINITPFTDVVLVLLLIFMIASPFLVVGALKVKLPEASTAESINDNKNVEVFLDSANKLYMNGKYLTMQELMIQIQMKLQVNPTQGVVIKADKEVFHGNFIKLLDELKKIGVTKFLIGATKRND